MAKRDILRVHVWTERYLGTRPKGEELLDLLQTMDNGRWVPEKWGHFEPIRSAFSPEMREAILAAWTEESPPGTGYASNSVLFKRRNPVVLICATTWRETVPDMNRIWLDLDAKPFATCNGMERLRGIMLDLMSWSQGVYGTMCHSRQSHKRIEQGTPLDMLKRLDWMTFFGEPYLELFGGRQRVLAAPCHSVQEVPSGVLLLAAPQPTSPEITESDRLLVSLEEYLNPLAFAGRGYPEVPCQVPNFDLSETIVPPKGRISAACNTI